MWCCHKHLKKKLNLEKKKQNLDHFMLSTAQVLEIGIAFWGKVSKTIQILNSWQWGPSQDQESISVCIQIQKSSFLITRLTIFSHTANNLQISGGYSSKFVSSNWKNSAFLGTPFCCSVCEVLNTPNYTQSDIDILGGSIPVSSRQTSISIPASSSSSQKTSHKVKHNVATGDSKAAIDYTKVCFVFLS